jgi:DNA recombination protein RmuC
MSHLEVVSVLLLFIGILAGALAGAAGAIVLARANREQLRDAMKAISSDVLAQTGDSLAQRLADQRRTEEERAAGEMSARAQELKQLVGPVHEKLTKVESELGRLERERRDSQVQLSEMVRALSAGTDTLRRETGELVSALKRPETRGAWGEIQLRRVVELAGMVAHCDFVEQHTIDTEGGRLRPDLLVRLPGGKLIVVDSKVPLDAYLASLEATGEEVGTQQARHARQTREHITKLATKGYQQQFDSTPELVVMFVPSDGIYQAALAADPALIEYGIQQHVLMATPTTLIGLLRAVHYGWSQEQIAESAREIAGSARELHRRVGKFAEHLAKVGRQLDSAVGSYNAAVGSFDHRVIPQLRSIEQAGISSEREIATPAGIETTARTVTAELDRDPLGAGAPDGNRLGMLDDDPLEAAVIAAPGLASPGGVSVDDRRALSRSAAE